MVGFWEHSIFCSLLLSNSELDSFFVDGFIISRLCDLVNEVNHHPDYDKSVVQGQGHTTKKKDVYQVVSGLCLYLETLDDAWNSFSNLNLNV